ncbi:MAG: hypothetical protein V3T67_03395 [Nitrosopumilaceae archaeon]
MKMLNSALLMLSASIILSVLTFGSFHTAFADFQLSKPYVLDGGGYAFDDKTIENSFIELSFLPAEQVGSKIKMKINDGTIIFEGKDFLFKQFDADILREGRFLRLIGFAEDNQGEQISLRFFGKLLGKSTDEFVYELRGKLERDGKEFDLYYVTKSGLKVAPQLIESKATGPPQIQPIVEEKSETKIELDVDYYKRVYARSVFNFNVKVNEISSEENILISNLPGVSITAEIYDSLDNKMQEYKGITDEMGFSDQFDVKYTFPYGTYKLKVSAEYNGVVAEKEIEFFVVRRPN